MWITCCFLAEITVLRAGSSITQHTFQCWFQFWYSPSGTIENSAPLCFRTMGSLQKKDTKSERAKLIPFQPQLEQKHSGANIHRTWSGQNQYSDLCGVSFFGLSLRLQPNFCKDDTSLSGLLKCHDTSARTLSCCVSTEYLQHLGEVVWAGILIHQVLSSVVVTVVKV